MVLYLYFYYIHYRKLSNLLTAAPFPLPQPEIYIPHNNRQSLLHILQSVIYSVADWPTQSSRGYCLARLPQLCSVLCKLVQCVYMTMQCFLQISIMCYHGYCKFVQLDTIITQCSLQINAIYTMVIQSVLQISTICYNGYLLLPANQYIMLQWLSSVLCKLVQCVTMII